MAANGRDYLDDYNPFGDASGRYDSSPPAVLTDGPPPPPFSAVADTPPRTTIQPPGPVTNSASISADAILALERRQAELDAYAAELERREKEQEARMNAAQSTASEHNWPPFPRWCPCRPCVRQDFETDIPIDCRWMAKMGYGLWLTYIIILLLNMGGTLSYFIKGDSRDGSSVFGASIAIALLMPPLTFHCWHRRLYNALRSDSWKNYVIFFVAFPVQIIISLIQCLGIDYLGSCGWINGGKMCSTSKTVCSYMLFVAALFTAFCALSVLLFLKVHHHYRHSDASLRKARLEMTTAAAYETSSSFGSMP